jgi:hypothetical protein
MDSLLGLDSPDDEHDAPADTDQSEQPYYRVKVNGETLEVTLPELQAGYSRDKDYRHKTQQIAAEKKALQEISSQAETDRQAAAQMRQTLSERLQQIDTSVSQSVQDPGQEYWDNLYESDPLGYIKQREQFRDLKDRQVSLASERQRLAAEAQQDQVREHQQLVQRESQALLHRVPEWKDAKRQDRELSQIKQHLTDYGYAAHEIDGVTDSRAVKLARDSWLLSQIREQTATARKKVSTAPKMTTTSRVRAPQTGNQRESVKLRETLRKSGSVDDALAILRARR